MAKIKKILEDFGEYNYVAGLDEVLIVLTNFLLFFDIYYKTNNEKRKNLW